MVYKGEQGCSPFTWFKIIPGLLNKLLKKTFISLLLVTYFALLACETLCRLLASRLALILKKLNIMSVIILSLLNSYSCISIFYHIISHISNSLHLEYNVALEIKNRFSLNNKLVFKRSGGNHIS